MRLAFPLLLASVLLLLAASTGSEALFIASNTWFAVSYLLCKFQYQTRKERKQCTPNLSDSRATTGRHNPLPNVSSATEADWAG